MARVLELDAVTAGYWPGRPVVRAIALAVDQGDFIAIIGPNGSGKTTLLRLMAGAVRPWRGQVVFCGQPLDRWPRRQLARRMAVVPQLSAPAFGFTVREFVSLGRTPYLAPWAALTRADIAAVDRALEATELISYADRPITELSGGELQRAVLARALAQEADVLLLDEPTAFLDPAHALAVVSLLKSLNAAGTTVVAVFHDLSLARHARRIVALRDGQLFADGAPAQVLDATHLTELYGARAVVLCGGGQTAVVFVEGSADAPPA